MDNAKDNAKKRAKIIRDGKEVILKRYRSDLVSEVNRRLAAAGMSPNYTHALGRPRLTDEERQAKTKARNIARVASLAKYHGLSPEDVLDALTEEG